MLEGNISDVLRLMQDIEHEVDDVDTMLKLLAMKINSITVQREAYHTRAIQAPSDAAWGCQGLDMLRRLSIPVRKQSAECQDI